MKISDIEQPSRDPVSITGKVIQTWGPKYFQRISSFSCSMCGNVIKIPVSFPYDDNLILPSRCPVSSGGCGMSKKKCAFSQVLDRSQLTKWYKIHLCDITTHFILILLDNDECPSKGDWIEFESNVIPRIKKKNLVISTWTGETQSFSLTT